MIKHPSSLIGAIIFFIWLLLELGPDPIMWLQAVSALTGIIAMFFIAGFICSIPVFVNRWFYRRTGKWILPAA